MSGITNVECRIPDPWKYIWWMWLGVLVVVVAVAVFILSPPDGAPFGLYKPESIYPLLLHLLFLSMILERALEVLIVLWRKRRREDFEAKLAETQQKFDNAKTFLATNDQGARRAARVTMMELGPKLVEQNKAIERYKGGTARRTFLVSIPIGMLLAGLLGMRVLNPLVDAFSVHDDVVGRLFHGLDIFITGLVIGGGSEGIHPLAPIHRKDECRSVLKGQGSAPVLLG